MNKNEANIPVVYIVGAGRSGSSILGEALGMLPEAIHLGEIIGIFDYATDTSGLSICSCGKPYDQCAFWNPLLTEAFGSNWQSVINSFGMLGRLPKTKALLLQKFLTRSGAITSNPVNKIVNLLKITIARTDAKVIIDSSKATSYALLLASSGFVNILLIHLVRDPRGVIYSWMHRPIPTYDETKQISMLNTRTLFNALGYWIISDIGAHIMRLQGYPYLRIRYEDFVTDPIKTIQLIADIAQKQEIPLHISEIAEKLLKEQKVLMQGHWSGSNPRLKTQHGIITIKSDDKWLDQQTSWEKFLLNLILSPWLIFYGYLGGK